MTFPVFLDENVNVELARVLRLDGCDALTAHEAGRANQGISDEGQLDFATHAGRALVTHDVKDFIVIARRWTEEGKHHAGIILSDIRPISVLREKFLRLFNAYPNGITDYCVWLPG